MIISRTPLRVSLAGGGTDIQDYYATEHGSVLSMSIKNYIYITVNKRFEDDIRVSYSKTEIVDSVDKIEHGIVRECLRKVGIASNIEVTTIADIPSKGTGLGSSSALTVGLLNALYAFTGHRASPKRLAEEACDIEIDILKEPIGKQDQYIAAYGGMQFIKFNADETVFVDPVICPPKMKRDIEKHMMLFYTGKTRNSGSILSKQKGNSSINRITLDKMRAQSERLFRELTSHRIEEIGAIMKEGWELKKSLATGISDGEIDKFYEKAMHAGAIGGKVTGAGGGGFLVFFVPPEHHQTVREALFSLKEVQFRIEPQGSKIIYVGDEM